jgi:hypothetical protein
MFPYWKFGNSPQKINCKHTWLYNNNFYTQILPPRTDRYTWSLTALYAHSQLGRGIQSCSTYHNYLTCPRHMSILHTTYWVLPITCQHIWHPASDPPNSPCPHLAPRLHTYHIGTIASTSGQCLISSHFSVVHSHNALHQIIPWFIVILYSVLCNREWYIVLITKHIAGACTQKPSYSPHKEVWGNGPLHIKFYTLTVGHAGIISFFFIDSRQTASTVYVQSLTLMNNQRKNVHGEVFHHRILHFEFVSAFR